MEICFKCGAQLETCDQTLDQLNEIIDNISPIRSNNSFLMICKVLIRNPNIVKHGKLKKTFVDKIAEVKLRHIEEDDIKILDEALALISPM